MSWILKKRRYVMQTQMRSKCWLVKEKNWLHKEPIRGTVKYYGIPETQFQVCTQVRAFFQMLSHMRQRALRTTLQLHCCNNNSCDVTVFRCRMKVQVILTWNAAMTCGRDIIDILAPQRNCGIVWTDLKPPKCIGLHHIFTELMKL